MNKRWVQTTGVVALILIGLGIWHLWFPGQSFDAKLWQTDARGDLGIRQRMVDRLLARQTLIGLAREQVIAMLGEPSPTDYFSEWDLEYRVGDERGFVSIDSNWLVLRLGSDGRITQVELVTD